MVEFRRERGGKKWALIEINARFWGSLPLALAAGMDFPLGLYQLLVEKKVKVTNQYKPDIYSRNWKLDAVWQVQNLRADAKDETLQTRPIRSVLSDVRHVLAGHEHMDTLTRDDPAPGFADLANIARSTGERVLKKTIATSFIRRHRSSRAKKALVFGGNLLFVCKGNICRSPFAEGLLKKLGFDGKVESAGSLSAGRPSPRAAIEAARKWGINLSRHNSKTLSSEMVERADLIFVFDHQNYLHMVNKFGFQALRRLFLLGDLLDEGSTFIADPWGGNEMDFEHCYRRIATALNVIRSESNCTSNRR